MKKLLVIPIMGAYYLLILVLFPIKLLLIVLNRAFEWLEDFTSDMSDYCDDYFMKLKSDKIIKWIEEASEKLRQGKPID